MELAGSTLTPEEDYALETAGFLIIENALGPEELRTFTAGRAHAYGDSEASGDHYAALFQGGMLTEHPLLTRYVEGITGAAVGDYGMDGPLRVLGSWNDSLPQTPSRVPLDRGGMAARGPLPGPSPVYVVRNGVRRCNRVTAVWALTDTVPGGGYVALAGSHKGAVPAPHAFREGQDLEWLEHRGVATEPQLKAGSLLLIVGSTIHGLRPGAKLNGEQLLAECKFVAGRLHSNESLAPPPPLPWTAELTAAEQTVLGLRDLPPAAGDVDAEPDDDDATELLRREQFMWDMCGYLVIKGVMGTAWLRAANDAVDAMEPSAPPPGVGQTISTWNKQFPNDVETAPSEELLGIGGVRLGGEFTWPQPHCEPFRRMIADEQLFQRLDWILGPQARMDDARGLLLSHPGTMGHSLHSGPMREHAYLSAGTPFGLGWADSVNVAWQLRDVPPGLGGFCAIPGSHKSCLSLPRERPTSIDLPQVVHVPMSAGDVLIFLAGQVTHGAFKWRQSVNRRCVLHNYVPNDRPLDGRNWAQFRQPEPKL